MFITCRFVNIEMKNVKFEDSRFENCYFEDIKSTETFFENCTLKNTVFYNTGAQFIPIPMFLISLGAWTIICIAVFLCRLHYLIILQICGKIQSSLTVSWKTQHFCTPKKAAI